MRNLALAILVAASPPSIFASPGSPPSPCISNLGAKTYFGSTEQLQTLQTRVRASRPATCPRVGIRFHTPERRTLVLYDRTTRSLVRVATWAGDREDRWEYWAGVTESALLRDDPSDGMDAGQYHSFGNARDLVPPATRTAVRIARQ